MTLNILLEGIFYNGHGFAEGNRILLRILDQSGYRVRIAARDKAERNLILPPKEVRYISSFEQTKLTSNDIFICNWIGTDIRYRADFRVNIARTTFETDRIPASWVPELNKFNEVWVQCAFNIHTFTSSGIRAPLKLIPNFFDMNRFSPQGDKLHLPIQQKFRFLSVFDLQYRKGYDVLLNAFLYEFSIKDDVALIIKIRDSSSNYKIEKILADHPKPRKDRPAIYIIDQMLTPTELLGLYRACHAFVLPSRGEGWGRPFFEAMLMELPTLGTNWSGQTEFMNESNSFLIQVERLASIKNSDYPLFNGHYWAEPSRKDLQMKMRYVCQHHTGAKEIGMKARRDLLKKYAMKEVAGRVVQEIDKYDSKHMGRRKPNEHFTGRNLL